MPGAAQVRWYVCICTYIIRTHVYIYMYICVYICYICCIYINIYPCTCKYVYLNICIHVMYACMYVCMYALCMYVCMYIYLCMYICVYMYRREVCIALVEPPEPQQSQAAAVRMKVCDSGAATAGCWALFNQRV